MPHSLSAKKRLRQDEKKRLQNKSVRSEVKTWIKKLETAVHNKDKALAEQYFRTAVQKLDKSVKKGVYHRNTVARKKSHCSKALHALG